MCHVREIFFHLVCCIEVFSHDGRLVLEDRELERVADNVQLLVTEVDSIVTRDVAQQVQGPRQSRVGCGVLLSILPTIPTLPLKRYCR